ncbi:MAG: hypothetical protein QM690_20460 [Sphingobium sp.]
MKMRSILLSAILFATAGSLSPAHAEGIGVEGDYGRADGRWGAELGAGYAFGAGGFKLTPGAGVFIRDGGTRAYGRVEATYTLPASATIGAGVRISEERTRPYATVALPLLPKVAVKGNVWSKYYTLGLAVGY